MHVVYVSPAPAQLIGHHLYTDEMRDSLIGGAQREAEMFLKEQAERIESDGGKVSETHLRSGDPDKEILRTAESLGVGLIVNRQPGLGRGEQGADGQRLGLRRSARPLSGVRGAQLG